jgi:hypothetical protein
MNAAIFVSFSAACDKCGKALHRKYDRDQTLCRKCRTRASKKAIVDARAARFFRHAGGRLTRRDARELGRLYSDSHWRFLGSMGDRLASRQPGDFARRFAENKRRGWLPEMRANLPNEFYWYGPRFGEWPGEWPVFE